MSNKRNHEVTRPWVEKYRPQTISDVESQEEIVKMLSATKENLPHLLFYGPPGSGKTSSILALARDIFGPIMKERVLELNASDKRGIDVIREAVKNFASTSINDKYSPFKLIILDEADSMTGDAQSALRRIIEKYTRVTRFCLICNYVSRIIDPLSSRCTKFRFAPLSDENIIKRLYMISEAEDVNVDKKSLKVILKKSGGDLRKAITLLQTASSYGNKKVTEDIVLDISGSIKPETVQELWKMVVSGDLNECINATKMVINHGLGVSLVIREVYDLVVNNEEIDDLDKSSILIEISNVIRNLQESADEELQLLGLFSFIQETIR